MSPSPTAVAGRREVTLGLVGMLESVIGAYVDRGSSPGALVGDGQAPKVADGEKAPRVPYAIVIEVPGGQVEEGWAGDPQVGWEYEVTSVGSTRNQATWMSDQVRAAVVGLGAVGYAHAITATPRVVMGRSLTSPGGATREGRLWNVSDVFRLTTSP